MFAPESPHVINRGDNRRRVFNSEDDYRLFIDRLGFFAETYRVKVRAFCLMPNHFHLYVCTPEGNLSRFMQSVLTSFTSIMNHRHRTSGHLFQGRFKSIVVDDRKYGMSLCRYIHLNPVRTTKFSRRPVAERRAELRGYAWSSYAGLIGLRECPAWLDKGENYPWPGNLREKQKRYAEFVEAGLLREIENPMEHVRAQSVLGSDSFTEMVRRKFLDLTGNISDCPQGKKLSAFLDFDRLSDTVAAFYGVGSELLFSKYGRCNEARQALIYFSELYCRGRYPLKDIAERLNLKLGGYASCRRSIREKLKRQKEMQAKYKSLSKQIEDVKCKN